MNSDKGRLAILRDMAGAVQKTGSAVLEDKYAQKTALRLGGFPRGRARRVQKNRRRQSQPPRRWPTAGEPETARRRPGFEALEQARPSEKEFWLLKLLLRQDELAPPARQFLDPDWLPHPLARSVVERRLAAQAAGNVAGSERVFGGVRLRRYTRT